MRASRKKPVAHPFEVPYPPDRALSPAVTYDPGANVSLQFRAEDESGHVRVTFEGFDALRVCRGEYLPYRLKGKAGGPGVYLVDGSHWLRERHAYEAQHYRRSYESGGDVDEMLTGFEHYLFAFHDEYVEVLARGVWFEHSRRRFRSGFSSAQHPLAPLPESAITGRFKVAGLTCQVRTNPVPEAELLRRARYCSQPQFDLMLEGDRVRTVWMRMDVRARRGEVLSTWRNGLGTPLATFPGLATLKQVKALATPELEEAAARRREMGR